MPTPSPVISRFRHAGAISREMAITVALVLIITASVAFNWSMIFGGSSTPPRIVEMGFQCLACDHQFTMTNEEFQDRNIDTDFMAKHPGHTVDMVDCPSCRQQHAATEQLKCPSCSKFYLPEKVNVRAVASEEKPIESVCPHCGTNMNEWHRQNHP